MSAAIRAFRILFTRGPRAAIDATLDHPPVRRRIHELRASLLGENVVTLDGIDVDPTQEVFSENMVDKIRGNRYENAERELLPRYIDPSLPIIDLGAGIGYTACLADHVTDASLNPVAVEPMPELHPVIRQTARLNDATIDIVHAAYDSEGETTTFFSATDFWSSSRYDRDSKEQTKTTVPSASLSELQERFDLEEEIQLIVDIEGGEHDLLTNELELLAETCSCLIIEFHPFTESTVGEYREMLENSGFEQLDCRDFVYVFSNRSVGPDPTAVV